MNRTFLDILNFFFVYVLSGLIISALTYYFFERKLDKKKCLLFGYGIAPLFISLTTYYLYAIFPHKNWPFYAFIIYGIFLLLFCTFYKQVLAFSKIESRHILNKIKKSFIASNTTFKILLLFISFIVLFSFIRGSIYPNTWTDSFSYLRQGYVYSHDRSLDRLITRLPFSEFGKSNKLMPPTQSYIMNTAIRPALPILYSFFFHDKTISEFEYFSIRLIYSYYFILAIFLLGYYLKKYTSNVLVGILAFSSCYYVLVYGPIFNAKEIILLFFSFFSFMLISEMKAVSDRLKLRYIVLIGTMIGLGIFINLSGIIIGGILFLLLIKEVGLKKKAWSILLATGLLLLIFSGSEIMNVFTFTFIPNKKILLNHDAMATFKSPELTRYNMADSKLDILLKGKLQGFTQIQFHGLIFIIFLITLFRVAKKHSLDHLSKNILLYIGLFFLIIMDPFFLNPHKYAYVLSISPKYTVLLSIFVAFFIARHFDSLIAIKESTKNRLIFSTLKYLFLLLSVLILLSPIRIFLANKLYFILSKIVPIYNSPLYYLQALNRFLLYLSVLSLLVFFILGVTKRLKATMVLSLTTQISILVIFLFIIPVTFSLNSNYNIYNTIAHTTNGNASKKLHMVTNAINGKQLYGIIDYINMNIDDDAKILITLRSSSNLYLDVWYLTKNNQRLIKNKNKPFENFKNADYLLIHRNRLTDFTLSHNYSKVLETPQFILYKIN